MFFSSVGFSQQNSQISQYAYSKLFYNPAVAGENSYTSITGIYRDQWSGIDGSPKSNFLSINFPTVIKRLGFGLSFQNQNIGIQTKTDISGMYAYKLNVGETTTSIGMQFSFRNFKNDFTNSSLLAIDGFDLDPSINREIYTESLFNVGIGAYFKAKRYYLGFSVPRMIRSSIDPIEFDDVSKESRHFYAAAGVEIPLSLDWTFHPQSLFKWSEQAPYDIDILALFIYRNQFHLGLNMRTGGTQQSLLESVDLLLGFKITNRIFLSMAYDFTLTDLREFENGSFELLLRYDFNNIVKPKEIENPRYFR